MTVFRGAIPDFQLANALYTGARVSFFTVEAGARTTTLATLYAAPSGAATLSNPQTLDSEGKFSAPVYIEEPVIASVVGPSVESHITGVIGLSPNTGSVNTLVGGVTSRSIAMFDDASGALLAGTTATFSVDGTLNLVAPLSIITTGISGLAVRSSSTSSASIALTNTASGGRSWSLFSSSGSSALPHSVFGLYDNTADVTRWYVDEHGRFNIGLDDGVVELADERAPLFKANTNTFVISGVATTGDAGQGAPSFVLRNRKPNPDTSTLGPGSTIFYQGLNSAGTFIEAVRLNGGVLDPAAGHEHGCLDIVIMRDGVAEVPMSFRGDLSGMVPSLSGAFDFGTLDNGAAIPELYRNAYFTGVGQFGTLKITGAQTVASAAGAVLNVVNIPQDTTTISGNTHITTAAGFDKVFISAPIYTAALALTVDNAATVFIQGAPIVGGSLAITNNYAFWVGAAGGGGTVRFDGVVVSTVTTGTAPFAVSSATKVSNLYADRAALADAVAAANITGLGTGIATFLATPSSANLASAITDEDGTGTVVFSASPTFTGTVAAANITATKVAVGGGPTTPPFSAHTATNRNWIIQDLGSIAQFAALNDGLGAYVAGKIDALDLKINVSSVGPATFGGSVVVGTAALATNATDGFLYIPTCAGTPTGTPSAKTGTVALVYDTTNHKLYIYDGAWKGGTAPGVWS